MVTYGKETSLNVLSVDSEFVKRGLNKPSYLKFCLKILRALYLFF